MDREKVIKAIDICLGHGKCDDCGYRIKGGYSTMDCRKPMMRDVLTLLKEQPQIVRCGECRHHGKGTCSAGAGIAYPPPDDWFCADGVAKDINVHNKEGR